MNRLVFSTLFDSYYLARGIALYESLRLHCENFVLYVFAFDDKTEKILNELNYENMKVVSLSNFEDDKLLSVKDSRTKGEYCWTSTSSTILYVLNEFGEDHCTYVDADILFFSSPKPLLDEFAESNADVMLTEHRFFKSYRGAEKNGIYCVQFMPFRNNSNGKEILNWWREKCLDWCYARYEDGKFGDQKYLDDWPHRFKGSVHIMQNEGGGVAPWNQQSYNFFRKANEILIHNENIEQKLIFYHYHALQFRSKEIVDLAHYNMNNDVKELVYFNYIKQLIRIDHELTARFGDGNYLGISRKKRGIQSILFKLKRILLRRNNIVKVTNGKIN